MDLALAGDLDDINVAFIAAIRGLEAQPGADTPDHTALGKRRIALARLASRRLGLLQKRLIPALAASGHHDAVRKFEERLRALFAATTAHVGAWPIAKVDADWPGYVAATRAMVAHVDGFLAAERREVYPLLATLARAA